MIRKTLAAASLAALVAVPAAASAAVAHGALDPSFGTAGVVLDPYTFFANDVVALPDGGVVLATQSMTLIKLRADGTRDPGFGVGGVAVLSGEEDVASDVRHLALDAQGRVLAAGNGFVARVLADGTLDPTWNGGSVVALSESVSSVLALPGGGVAVAGESDDTAAAAVLTATGTLDPAFSGDGHAQIGIADTPTTFTDLIADGFGGYYLTGEAGDDLYLVHLRRDGAPDPAFGTDGRVREGVGEPGDIARARALVMTADRRLVVAGVASVDGDGDGFVGRFRADGGAPDPGLIPVDLEPEDYDELTDIALSIDGDLLVGGAIGVTGARDAVVARLHPDGTLDTTFGLIRHHPPRGGAIVRALTRDSYGAITAVGTSQDTILGLRIADRGFTPRPTTQNPPPLPTGGGGTTATPPPVITPDPPAAEAPSEEQSPVVVPPDTRPGTYRPSAWFHRVRSTLRLTGQADQGAARVQVAIQRRTGQKCAVLTSSRRARLSKPTACRTTKTRWLTTKIQPRAGRTTTWTLRFGKRPAPGRYTATVRALDPQGNAGKTARVTFRVR
jgi:uncharacterized delta-60 repeat protein